MSFTVEEIVEPREPFGPCRYRILENGRAVAVFVHNFRGECEWIETADGRGEDPPFGMCSEFLSGGGPHPLGLTMKAEEYLDTLLCAGRWARQTTPSRRAPSAAAPGMCRELPDAEGATDAMIPGVLIRGESERDVEAITALTAAAFETLDVSDHTEQVVIEELRAAGALAISLVAELDGRVVGHIAFSPVTVADGTTDWYGLGPVSVLPELQRRGIGGALIREGLSRLKAIGARGCCLVGHPGYYGRFGFENTPGLFVEKAPPEAFFAQSFDGRMPAGAVTFHEAFGVGGGA